MTDPVSRPDPLSILVRAQQRREVSEAISQAAAHMWNAARMLDDIGGSARADRFRRLREQLLKAERVTP